MSATVMPYAARGAREAAFMPGYSLRKTLVRACAGAVLTMAIACDSGSPTSPTAATVDVSGAWNARIAAVQQRSGAAQLDEALITLRQAGAGVTGTIRYSGLSAGANVSGSVSGDTFTFTATQVLSPTCSASVEAAVRVSASGNEIAGSYRAVTCEDTVIGTLTARRQ